MSKTSPYPEFYRALSKRGYADCTIASMAIIFRREQDAVLLAAAKVQPNVWTEGLGVDEMAAVARELGIDVAWLSYSQFDPRHATGILWVSPDDVAADHCVALIDGVVVDPEYNPPAIAPYDLYRKGTELYGNALLVMKD